MRISLHRSLPFLRSGAFAICAILLAFPACAAEAPWYLTGKDSAPGDQAEARTPVSGENSETSAVAPLRPIQPARVDGKLRRTVNPGHEVVPLSNGDKARLMILSTFEPASLARIAVTSGLATLRDSPSEWPRTVETYNWRFADRVGQRLVYKNTQFVVGSLLLKEDPRYFLSEDESNWGKIKNAFKQTWATRRDNGKWAPAYGTFAGAYAAGAVSAQWMPESRQQWDSILIRSSTQIGLQFCNNLLREYTPLLKRKFHR